MWGDKGQPEGCILMFFLYMHSSKTFLLKPWDMTQFRTSPPWHSYLIKTQQGSVSTLSPTHPRLSLVSQQMFLPWSHGGCPETDFQSRYLIPQNLHPVGDGPSRTSSLPDRLALWRSVAISMKPALGCPRRLKELSASTVGHTGIPKFRDSHGDLCPNSRVPVCGPVSEPLSGISLVSYIQHFTRPLSTSLVFSAGLSCIPSLVLAAVGERSFAIN